MVKRGARKNKSLSRQAVELAVAVPQVVARRLTRLALAGPKPSARDRREFQRMGAEKVTAFAESWSAMASEAARCSQAVSRSLLSALFMPSPMARSKALRQTRQATTEILRRGLSPVHGRAVANAKRLSRKNKK